MIVNTNPWKSFFDVKDFMHVMKQEVRNEETTVIPERELRIKLIKDEIDELREKGFQKKNVTEIFDALADIVYVAWGAAISHGLLNNAKALEYIRNGNDYIINGSNIFVSPPHETLVKNFPTDFEMEEKNKMPIFDSLMDRYTDSSNDGDESRMLINLFLIINECYKLSFNYGIDLDLVLDEVHDSNMTKRLGDTGTTLYHEEGELKGKVKKGKLFREADIDKVIYA